MLKHLRSQHSSISFDSGTEQVSSERFVKKSFAIKKRKLQAKSGEGKQQEIFGLGLSPIASVISESRMMKANESISLDMASSKNIWPPYTTSTPAKARKPCTSKNKVGEREKSLGLRKRPPVNKKCTFDFKKGVFFFFEKKSNYPYNLFVLIYFSARYGPNRFL